MTLDQQRAAIWTMVFSLVFCVALVCLAVWLWRKWRGPPAPMSAIVLTRHVLVLAVGALLAVSFSRERLSWEGWLVTWGVCAAAGLLAAGLASLFFTSSQARHWRVNAVVASWVMIGLTTFGDLQSSNSSRAEPAVSAPPTEPPAPLAQEFDPSTARLDVPSGGSSIASAKVEIKPPPWKERVARLRAGVTAGTQSVTPSGGLSEYPAASSEWSTSDVQSLERSQTWWVSGDLVHVHLPSSPMQLSSYEFYFWPGACEQATPTVPPNATRYLIKLQATKPAGQETISVFKAPDLATSVSGGGCLTISRVWL